MVVFIVWFLVILATGFEFTFKAPGFPAIAETLKSSLYYVKVAYFGGITGSMLSPAHTYLILLLRYSLTRVEEVYKYTATTTLKTAFTLLFTFAT